MHRDGFPSFPPQAGKRQGKRDGNEKKNGGECMRHAPPEVKNLEYPTLRNSGEGWGTQKRYVY